MTTINISIPEDIASQLENRWGNLSQKTLEAIAIAAYESEVLTFGEVQRLLGFNSRWETEEFLCRYHAYLHYDKDELKSDILTLSLLRNKQQ